MKLLVTFFIFICFDLFVGQGPGITCSHYLNTYNSSGSFHTKTTEVESKHTLLTHHTDTAGENELAVLVEEDDEENNRKCRSSIEFFSTCCYAFNNSYPRRDLTNRISILRSFSHIRSCKYIAQRVLRI